MKRQHLCAILVLPAPLLFACAAPARSRPAQTQPPQQNPSAQQVPTTSSQTMQCANGGNCYDNNTTDRDTGPATPHNGMRGKQGFSSLAGSKGYVGKSDTAGRPWLASHFSQCDKNQDGKLSRSEYKHCRREYARGRGH